MKKREDMKKHKRSERRETRLWFRAKRYGWGWYPATWEGWLVLLGFVIVELYALYVTDVLSHSVSDTLSNFVPISVVMILILILICYFKGEEPGWRWG